MADHSKMRLGKKARRSDLRTLKLARYMTSALPAAPASVDYSHGITDWGVMLNDRLGCCTIAAVGHAVQAWTANALARELTVPDSAILNYYQKWDGYNPVVPGSDQGGVELDVLNDWRQQGFNGQSLDAFVAIDLWDSGPGTKDSASQIPSIATAIWLFGGAYIGVELPIAAQNQDIWDVPANPGPNDEPSSWGGHAIYLVGYDSAGQDSGARIQDSVTRAAQGAASPNPKSFSPNPGSLTCVTWGQLKKMTWAWFQKYCSEAYALVSKDWMEASGIAPSGFDLAALEKDLEEVSGAGCQVSGKEIKFQAVGI